MMSHVPLKALTKSIKDAGRALREKDVNDDEGGGTQTEEEQRIQREQLLQKARRLSTKKIRSSIFVKSSFVGDVEDLLALHDEEIQVDNEIEGAALDERDALSRRRGEALRISYSSRLETLGRFMWNKRFFRLQTRFLTDINTQNEITEHIYLLVTPKKVVLCNFALILRESPLCLC